MIVDLDIWVLNSFPGYKNTRADDSKLLIYLDPFFCCDDSSEQQRLFYLIKITYNYIDLHFCINDGKYHT